MASESLSSKHYKYKLAEIVILLFIVLIFPTGCGKDDKPEVRSWIDNDYSSLSDSLLLQMVDNNDTLAAIALGWRYMQNKDTASAVNLFKGFNTYYDKASPDLTYLSALSFQGAGKDSLALHYIQPLLKKKSYPEAKYLAAASQLKLENYDEALRIFKNLRKLDKEAIDDSILRCKAEQGDTLSAIAFASKMLSKNKINKAAPYFGRFVSLSRGVSPPFWSYEAGITFYKGHNYTRAAVFLENADADTNFAELSVWAGRAYYMLQVYDSAASKFEQAYEMGDSSAMVLDLLMMSYSGSDLIEQTLEVCKRGMLLHPDYEKFYFAPAKYYYEQKEYQKLLELAQYGLKYVNSSYKLESYNIAAKILLGNEAEVDSLVDLLIAGYRFQAGALSEATKLFETSINRPDIVARLDSANYCKKYPEVNNWLFWYGKLKENNYYDSAKVLLEMWLDDDTLQDRLQFMQELYKHDFPDG